ncbi:Alpha-ketoglutaric semialdehyde dehydrogenase 1 [Rhodovastum atsumiense]|uniref:NAD-dependent succinate-semialdehyde dehydrogenase n=1 Tax=Rhodovastum atsumiense TaxID=504468 RepID=A0A5M6IL08_9PROT|nr:NAD-dependent succinate-semialdehyde dehydrogenase [Rhodovastum atsumiense]KAA5608549.1 NAD-dependent succinate-semialdehyde dehydrogenase [Rhodovastum atsumiense]CAH2599978.1 Alpha-ketoglutaric semialdehyde dehydrogenase 1 [Rhodovastum atsumiense]
MSSADYPAVPLFIDGAWTPARSGKTLTVVNPATGEALGTLAHAGTEDLDQALAAAERGFAVWRKVSAHDRAKVMRKAATLIRERADSIARLMTLEQGKPLAEAKGELLFAGDIIEWFAEEARRTYGRVIPARAEGVTQLVVKEPVGVVAAFTPWNFPVNQAVRKISAGVAAGCAVILKGPEETPASCAELVRVYQDAGLPPGVVQLVFGVPAEISEYLIPHPTVKKISFTGSTVVGKHLTALAGAHMKRVTMELGGHAPVIVFEDADIAAAARILAANKFRNAGQVCISPTRFLVQESVYEDFVGRFVDFARAVKVGDGLQPGTTMGPLANPRRVTAMEGFVQDAVQKGAELRTGGKRIGNKGNFFEPTVLTGVTREMRVMNEEPFGPLALMMPFHGFDDAVAEANRLPFGLASYAYTRSVKTASAIAAAVESGMMSINHHGLALPEVPFGGIKDSGYGSEGGSEAIEAYLNTKFITQAEA